jgi:hypothetical protein
VNLFSSLFLLHPDSQRRALEYLIGGRSTFFSYVEICSFVAFAAVQPPTLRVQAKSRIHRYLRNTERIGSQKRRWDRWLSLVGGVYIRAVYCTSAGR